MPQIVGLQAHGVVATPYLDSVHVALDDESDMTPLGSPGEGGEHIARAVSDPSLLAFNHIRAVGLESRGRLEVIGIGPRIRLGEGETSPLAPGNQIREEPILLLLRTVHDDALVTDRLVDAEHHGQRRINLPDVLEHLAVTGLGEPQAPVLGIHIEPEKTHLPQLAQSALRKSAVALDLERVVVVSRPVSELLDNPLYSCALIRVDPGKWKHHVLVDLAQEEAPGKGLRGVVGHERSPERRRSPDLAASTSSVAGRKRGPCSSARASSFSTTLSLPRRSMK